MVITDFNSSSLPLISISTSPTIGSSRHVRLLLTFISFIRQPLLRQLQFHVNQDASTTNKIQYSRILGSNASAPQLNLTPEGYLAIVKGFKAQVVISAPYGTENQTWIAFSHMPPPTQPFPFDNFTNVLACANCLPLVFWKVVKSDITYCRMINTAQPTQICSARTLLSYAGFWSGSRAAAISNSSFQEQSYASDIGVRGHNFGTPTNY